MGDHGSQNPRSPESLQVVMARSEPEQAILGKRCALENTRFREAPLSELRSDVLDLRALHSRLYDGLCPALPQTVGTFRGTQGSPLEFAKRAVKTRGDVAGLRTLDTCLDPAEVVSAMDLFQAQLADYWKDQKLSDPIEILATFTHQFFWVHPFLDGNGHVWRLAMIALARRAGLEINDSWTIATRSYGAPFSYALQRYAEAPELLNAELTRFFKPTA